MSRIAPVFEALRAAGRKALIPYVTAGFPRREDTLPILRSMVAAGADVIELGVPFSDPMADGPVIQRAGDRALAQGVGLTDVLAFVADYRREDGKTPIVLMGYANPIERMGLERFIARAREAGVDGVLVVDYPPEESAAYATQLRAAGLDPIFLLAPTSGEERVARVAALASGYVYYVSLKGVTGAGHLDVAEAVRRVAQIKTRVPLPVGVGFGIRDGRTATAIAASADAVVIGTRLIEVLESGDPAQAAERAGRFIADIRGALDATATPATA